LVREVEIREVVEIERVEQSKYRNPIVDTAPYLADFRHAQCRSAIRKQQVAGIDEATTH
jgi:hypothetical protein